MIFTGLPVVSTPYMPAALMPMPCWPRLIRRRWNFEPYSSLPKISGICFLRMPGPLSCTPTLKRFAPVCFDVDPDLGQDAGLFAGVERVVDRLLDRGQQGLAGIVEAQQVAVLGEELADRDIALAAAIDWAVARRRGCSAGCSGFVIDSSARAAGGSGRLCSAPAIIRALPFRRFILRGRDFPDPPQSFRMAGGLGFRTNQNNRLRYWPAIGVRTANRCGYS